MTFSEDVLKNEEKAMMNLRALYGMYGYTQYKMSKFEEYDLYVRNKSFLPSEQIITFNDTNGKLMALKPDVTLSIVKNSKDSESSLCKYFYNENVYRLSHTSNEFKERMQVGLECIGNIDLYSMSEVIMLADKSLRTISEKNAPEIKKLCDEFKLSDTDTVKLMKLAALYGTFEEAIVVLREISDNARTAEALEELEQVYETVKSLGGGDNIHLDFSIVNDMNYYSGIIFQGFIDGIPTGILSGGRYDNLMLRFGKKSGAIGFAVYIDLLERFEVSKRAFDVDVLILYDENTDTNTLALAVKTLTDQNRSVRALHGEAGNIKCRQLMTIKDGRLNVLETND